MSEYVSGLVAGIVMMAYFVAYSLAGNNGRIVLLLAFMAMVFAWEVVKAKNGQPCEPAQDDS